MSVITLWMIMLIVVMFTLFLNVYTNIQIWGIFPFSQDDIVQFRKCENYKCYGMFTVHFYKIENNDFQQMPFSMFIIYTNTPHTVLHWPHIVLLLDHVLLYITQLTGDGPQGPKHIGVFVYIINILKYICWKSLFSIVKNILYKKLYILDSC